MVCGRREKKVLCQHDLNKKDYKAFLCVAKSLPENIKASYPCRHPIRCRQWNFYLLEYLIEDK